MTAAKHSLPFRYLPTTLLPDNPPRPHASSLCFSRPTSTYLDNSEEERPWLRLGSDSFLLFTLSFSLWKDTHKGVMEREAGRRLFVFL